MMRHRLGLPTPIRGCLFDLDGVLTPTATLHRLAWKRMFDAYLRSERGDGFVPFDDDDYATYVDGKLRSDGVRSFLASRGLPASAATVAELGERKNALVLQLIAECGVEAYDDAIQYLAAVREAGLPCGVVSSSTNCRQVLESAGIEGLFDVGVDGIDARREHLPGKPAPDIYLAAARRLDLPPGATAVFEDALAGVEAARAGAFGLVVGVDREARAAAGLRAAGADLVVRDLAELLVPA